MKNYTVLCNNKEVPVIPARTSAVPYNRCWPGHQRPLDQTEISYFVSTELENGRAEISVTVSGCDLGAPEIRPLSKKIPFLMDGSTIKITVTEPMQFTLEVGGKSEALAVFVNHPFVCPKGNRVHYFSPGEHDIGILYPKSGDTVVIDDGAILFGSIEVIDAENVRIVGRGVLDGSRLSRTDEKYDKCIENLFVIKNSKNVSVEGIILRDAPCWALTVRNACENIHVDNVKLVGMWRYNSDGIDICTSKNVLVENSFIRSFDDCTVVRGVHLTGEEGGGCDGVSFKNCILWCDWGKNLEVWSGMHDSYIKNVSFENMYLIHVSYIGISVDTWYGSKNITVNNIRYRNIFVEGEADEKTQMLQTDDNVSYEEAVSKSSAIPHRILDIEVSRLGKYTGNQGCDEGAPIDEFRVEYSDISIENVSLIGEKNAYCSKIDGTKLAKLTNLSINNSELGKLSVVNCPKI